MGIGLVQPECVALKTVSKPLRPLTAFVTLLQCSSST
jgi:hypothetical protein